MMPKLLRLICKFSQYYPPQRIRNFCIIAHIDHGKSTLADRLLEITNTIPKNSASQFLDKLKVQRDRGITVQAQTVSMLYTYQGANYLLNLVDTPGHVDFHYEVERSMRGCQGALLLVDVTQGIQAQTLANYQLAKREGLIVLPVLNKIDVSADIDQVQQQVKSQIKIQKISRVSAKTGLNVEMLLHRIIEDIPHPKVDSKDDKLKLFLINSWFLNGKNVICLFYVMGGTLQKNISICSSAFSKTYHVFDVGILQPQLTSQLSLTPGQIGFVLSNMKLVKEARIGDTFYKIGQKVQPEPGFLPSKPMMYAGLYPVDGDDFPVLQKSLQKLVLTDPAVTYMRQSNATLGNGFRCGFLGMLHLDVFKQRLIDQYQVEAIFTSPSVPYKCKLNNGQVKFIESALEAPNKSQVEYFQQPIVSSTFVFPNQYLSEIKSLCETRRGELLSEASLGQKIVLKYHLPLSEIIIDFVDKLKSITHGYASFDYEMDGYKITNLTKIVIHIMNEPVDALTFLVYDKNAFQFGKNICIKLKEQIPQQLFTINIQARVGSKTIAKQQIPHIKKHVTAKCYGGDYSRKRKLLERYKEGKKKLKQIGKVQIHKDTFLKILKN